MLRLRSLREEIGMTQAQMAEIFKISRQVYANYENEINQPSLQLLIMMADYFQCSVDYLIGRSDDLGNITVSQNFTYNDAFSLEEKALIKDLRQLSFTDRKTITEYTNFLKEKHKT